MKRKIVVGILLAAGIVTIFGWWISRPAKGNIVKRKNILEVAKINEWQLYQGRKFSFEYPPELTIGASEEVKVIMVGTGGKSWQLAVIAKEYSDDINELADIKMRKIKTETYDLFYIDDKTCYSRKEAWEKVCWWQKDDMVVSMALTANTNDPELDKVYERLVKSIRLNPPTL